MIGEKFCQFNKKCLRVVEWYLKKGKKVVFFSDIDNNGFF